MTPFEYLLLRYVHDVASGEFVNVGVVGLDLAHARLTPFINTRYRRVSAFFPDLDGSEFRRYTRRLQTQLEHIASNLRQGDFVRGSHATIDDVVSQVLPRDDSSFQWSPVMGGLTVNFSQRMQELFQEHVLRNEEESSRVRRDDQAIESALQSHLIERQLVPSVRFDYPIETPDYSFTFAAGWANGQPQVLHPISLDYARPADVIERANTWSGRLYTLSRKAKPFLFTGVVAPPSDSALRDEYEHAVCILRMAPQVRTIIDEAAFPQFMEEIAADVQSGDPEGPPPTGAS